MYDAVNPSLVASINAPSTVISIPVISATIELTADEQEFIALRRLLSPLEQGRITNAMYEAQGRDNNLAAARRYRAVRQLELALELLASGVSVSTLCAAESVSARHAFDYKKIAKALARIIAEQDAAEQDTTTA